MTATEKTILKRLDTALAERFPTYSRTRAQSLIADGLVTVDGTVIKKAAYAVSDAQQIEIDERFRYVARSGVKLESALTSFCINPDGLTAVDIGASTGGFTQCLLMHGAKHVYAVDVGHGQLNECLRCDSRVTCMEGVNGRELTKDSFPTGVELVVMDVSFISQTLIFPAIGDILSNGGMAITLIKPQFEAGRKYIGKGGIVKDANGTVFDSINLRLKVAGNENHLEQLKVIPSPIDGGDGNKEYLALWKRV